MYVVGSFSAKMEGKRTSKEFSEFQVEFYELHPRIITFLLKSPFIVYGLTHGVLDTTAARPYDERAFQQRRG
jgi:hypothetical protein